MKLKDLFKPKPNKFLLLLVEQTNITVKGLEQLTQYLKKRSAYCCQTNLRNREAGR